MQINTLNFGINRGQASARAGGGTAPPSENELTEDDGLTTLTQDDGTTVLTED